MIALYDSGYGGLTVLKPIMKLLPQYDYVYLGDNARSPYGSHNPDTIKRFSRQAVNYLFNRGVVLIIFACNTTSAVALKTIQEEYLRRNNEKDRKILGVLIPVAEKVAGMPDIRRVGVVGTRTTINSEAYIKEIHKRNPDIKIFSQACPLLVPLIEENWHKKPEAISILKKYLRPLKTNNLDSLILGCTHYPLMDKNFKRIMGKKVQIINSGEISAKSLKDYLERHPEIEQKISRNKKRFFITTEDPEKFKAFTEKHFQIKIRTPEKIELK